ncbi:PD-(D/E)XK nuclease family protein [Spongiibacter taiwanensis]|uniref:PD-(D/E)XK nuclease family protein n=1 Tax=Spongiibacter taiwanensis TaxID=1748242 RepID=UPI0020365F23|nr:PD-(D/E)XK nuclease family protein [Spongiibacter taiwanensis]USA41686.1 PD-(D/E)XK nuclease family protein [Spongiibacter taiwanensis]
MTDIGLEEILRLEGEVLVLMPSDTAARQCRDAIARLRGEQDQAFLESITIVPPDQWLAGLWDNCFADRQVLRPIQLLALARGIIEASPHYPANCLNPLAITRQFVDAFQLHAAYCLGDRREDYLFSPEYQAFSEWREALQDTLDTQQALSSQQLPHYLLAQPSLALPDHIVISPDLEFPPAMQRFLDHCGCHCQRWRLAVRRSMSTPRLVSVQQQRQECEQVATWLAKTLPDRAPSDLICIAVPDIERYQADLQSALARYLYPQTLFPPVGSGSDPDVAAPAIREPWVFEGSEKILSFPLISAAWDVISLGNSSVETEKLSRILRSRFIRGWPEHRSDRASLDLRWREYLGPETTLASALALSRHSPTVTDEMLEPLTAIAQIVGQAPARQLPSRWVRFFDQLLLAAGWPNADNDDLVVQQCRRGFSQAMDVFRALDRQLGEIAQGDALSWLQHILASKRFSIARDWWCPVRIMSYEDAIGREFDAIWIMGLDDSALPRRVEPSPFLPLHLQQRAAIPDASAATRLAADKKVLNALLAVAPEVMVSHCQQNENGAPLAASPLLSMAASAPPLTSALGFQCSADLIQPQNDAVSPVGVAEREQLRGGTGLFKEYAASPFLAFLKYRLQLAEFPQPREGLDQRIQGVLVHDSLQFFWQQTGDSAALASLTATQLAVRVEECVVRAFAHPELRSGRYGDTLKQLEIRRLCSLLGAWLEKERTRLEPFTVIATEQQREYRLMGIPLRLRVDRIDQIGEHRLVIDYKTGRVEGRNLNVDQLSEPQLPIYALAEADAGAPVDGVMLAQVKSVDELSIHLRSNWTNSVVKKVPRDKDVDTPEKWAEELSAWERALTTMAEGILGGDIGHDFSQDHQRGFSAYLLPLLRGEGAADGESAGEGAQ